MKTHVLLAFVGFSDEFYHARIYPNDDTQGACWNVDDAFGHA